MDIGVGRVADVEQWAPCLAMPVHGQLLVLPSVEGEHVDEQGRIACVVRVPKIVPLRSRTGTKRGLWLAMRSSSTSASRLLFSVVVGSRGDRHVLGHGGDIRFIGGRGGVIDGAGRGEEIAQLFVIAPGHAGRPAPRAPGVDIALAIQLWGKIGGWVVRQSRQLDDRVDAFQPRWARGDVNRPR